MLHCTEESRGRKLKKKQTNLIQLNFEWSLKSEAVPRRYSVKKVLLKILLNSQENTCGRVSFLIKLQALQLIKKDSSEGVFLWILRNFQEHLFSQNTSRGCFCKVFSSVILSQLDNEFEWILMDLVWTCTYQIHYQHNKYDSDVKTISTTKVRKQENVFSVNSLTL